jgi:predicted phage terminase large subunit-like protein
VGDAVVITPQPGPQTGFFASTADILVYGGAVFGGKTWALLADPTRWITRVNGYGAVCFRRQLKQVLNEGGLWDKAKEFYRPFRPEAIENPFRFTFPPFGNKIEFHHLNQASDVESWDGSEIPAVLWDELQHFEESQFWYIYSRNRSSCGVRPYMRATCNPVKRRDHWLRKLLSWWIDDESGWPIEERAGVIRYFLRISNVIHWADDPAELVERFPSPPGEPDPEPTSFTFIPATMDDNRIGLELDPGYRGRVQAQTESERLRMSGNWNAQPSAGELMRREDFEIVEPADVPFLRNQIRYWDRAGTLPHEGNPDPDWTAGARLSVDADGVIWILHIDRFRFEPQRVQKRIKLRTTIEKAEVVAVLERDPAQAGKAEISWYYEKFAGLPLEDTGKTPKKGKLTVWRPFASQARAGRVKLVRGDWNEAFLAEAESVIDGLSDDIHDDQIDAVAGGYLYLLERGGGGAQAGADHDYY